VKRSKTRARTSGACVTLFATCARSFEGANGEDRAPCELSVSREELIQRMYAAKNEYDALIAELDKKEADGG
jgi:hypothetical protein